MPDVQGCRFILSFITASTSSSVSLQSQRLQSAVSAMADIMMLGRREYCYGVVWVFETLHLFSSSVTRSSFWPSRLVRCDTWCVNASILVASWVGKSAFFRLLSSRSSLRSSMMLSVSDSLTISATRNAVACLSSAVSSDVLFLDLGPIAFGWMRPHPCDYATARWRLLALTNRTCQSANSKNYP